MFLRLKFGKISPPKKPLLVQVDIQKIETCLKLSYLACSQSWLNFPMDYHHFGYITKLTKKDIELDSPLIFSIKKTCLE
jgi:hypothetical protein